VKVHAFKKGVQRNAALPKLLKIPGKNVPELSGKADKGKVGIAGREVVFIIAARIKTALRWNNKACF